MPTELLITNIGLAISFVVSLSLGVVAFVRRIKGDSTNIVFLWMSLGMALWAVSYGLGINLSDPILSRNLFMVGVLSSLFTVIFNAHLIVVMAGRFASQKRILIALYSISGAIVIFYALFPNTLLLASHPKLYLANFLVLGDFYFIQDYYFFFCVLYLLFCTFEAYHRGDYRLRNKLKYFIVAIIYGYGLALLPELLLYDINVDPLLACLSGFYTVPIAYGIIKYDTLDLNIVAKRALGYAVSIAGVTLFILFIGYANDTVVAFIPTFPRWLLPLFSGALAVGVGVIVWKKIKEVDVLKYQFIDVVTHKFRTPLTHIRWSVDNLRTATTPEERNKSLDDIGEAHSKLYQLTDLLVGLSASDDSQFLYNYLPENIQVVIKKTLRAVEGRIQEKNVIIENKVADNLPLVSMDQSRIQFALQMVLENAITYSPVGGSVIISAEVKHDTLVMSVKDSGIGVSKEDMARLFSKFFRSSSALRTHTEGLGIGLYLSHDILRRHGGDLWAESQGVGKGTTFFFKLPLAK
ncbi:MAG: ATP-binding protein [Patescibacteria group bacterium]